MQVMRTAARGILNTSATTTHLAQTQWERRRDTVPITLAQLTKCGRSEMKSLQSLCESTPDRRLPPPIVMCFLVSGNVSNLRSVNQKYHWGRRYVKQSMIQLGFLFRLRYQAARLGLLRRVALDDLGNFEDILLGGPVCMTP